MSSRKNSDSARLRRLKRLGQRHGLAILTTGKPNPRFPDGGYMLSHEATRRPILGDKPMPYCASLDEIEAYFDAFAAGDDGEDDPS